MSVTREPLTLSLGRVAEALESHASDVRLGVVPEDVEPDSDADPRPTWGEAASAVREAIEALTIGEAK